MSKGYFYNQQHQIVQLNGDAHEIANTIWKHVQKPSHIIRTGLNYIWIDNMSIIFSGTDYEFIKDVFIKLDEKLPPEFKCEFI